MLRDGKSSLYNKVGVFRCFEGLLKTVFFRFTLFFPLLFSHRYVDVRHENYIDLTKTPNIIVSIVMASSIASARVTYQ